MPITTWVYSLDNPTTCYGPLDYAAPYPTLPTQWWETLTDDEWEYQKPIEWIDQFSGQGGRSALPEAIKRPSDEGKNS